MYKVISEELRKEKVIATFETLGEAIIFQENYKCRKWETTYLRKV